MMVVKSKLNLLAYIIVLEMVLGGSGRLLTLGSFLTLKYLLFIVAMIYFCGITMARKLRIEKNIFYIPVLVFLALYFLAIANGYIQGYPLADIMSSSQGYLYFLMLFPFTLFINKTEHVKIVLRIIERSALVLAVMSIFLFILLYLSPHKIYSIVNPVLMSTSYGFLDIPKGLPRVFFKTSPFMAIAFILELFNYVNLYNKKDIRSIAKMMILLLGCMTTMTMGIWLAVGIGIILCIVFSNGKKRIIVQSLILVSPILFPFSNSIANILVNRFSKTDTSYIIKLNELYTMLSIWVNSFFLGKGFGITIIFQNEIKDRTMVKFELFWLELLVCMGITGFIAFVYMILKTLHKGLKAAKATRVTALSDSIQLKAMVTGLVMLCVISSVNPFLNNPIGIGYLLIVMCSINVYYKPLTIRKLVKLQA